MVCGVERVAARGGVGEWTPTRGGDHPATCPGAPELPAATGVASHLPWHGDVTCGQPTYQDAGRSSESCATWHALVSTVFAFLAMGCNPDPAAPLQITASEVRPEMVTGAATQALGDDGFFRMLHRDGA